MDFRTDLASERREMLGENSIDGIETYVREFENATVNEIRIVNKNGEEAMGRKAGRYITVEVPAFSSSAELLDGRLDALTQEIRSLIPDSGTVLVAGLGNLNITADALGPKCADMIFATRHISCELARSLGMDGLRSVCAVTPGVLGKTGIETSEIIKGLSENVKPSVIITVDALAARKLSRLACTVQICDTGIFPGSGVGNRRSEISSETMGVPVISIGIPTVINAAAVAREFTGDESIGSSKGEFSDMIVTPRETDLISQRGAKLIALALNCALQPSVSPGDLLSLM